MTRGQVGCFLVQEEKALRVNEFCRGISMETRELLTIEQFTVWEPILPSLVKVMRAVLYSNLYAVLGTNLPNVPGD